MSASLHQIAGGDGWHPTASSRNSPAPAATGAGLLEAPLKTDEEIRDMLNVAIGTGKGSLMAFCHQHGLSIQAVSSTRYGNRSPSSRLCAALGVKRLTFRMQRLRRMRQLWNENLPINEIARRLGCCPQLVRLEARVGSWTRP